METEIEEDIKEIECFFNKNFFVNGSWASIHRNEIANLEESIENLLKAYKELKEENEKLKENCKKCVVRDRLHEYEENTIPKSKAKEKIEEIEQEDLEIYDTDSENLVVAKYEYRAVLDALQDLLREE